MVELEDLNEEISTVIRVLKRSRRPVREDLEVLSQEKWSQFFPFASVMEAEGFLDDYYSKDSANDKVDRLAYGLS